MKRYITCSIALMMVIGAGLTGCRKKQTEPASPTDIATPTDLTTTVATDETTVETEIVEVTNEKGEKQTIIRTKAANNSGGNSNGSSGGNGSASGGSGSSGGNSSGNSGSNSSGNSGGNGGGQATTKALTTTKAPTPQTANILNEVRSVNASINKRGFPSKQSRINQMAQQLANGSISASAVKSEIMGWGQMVENGILWEARSVYAERIKIKPGGPREVSQQCYAGFSTASYGVIVAVNQGGQYYAGKIAIR